MAKKKGITQRQDDTAMASKDNSTQNPKAGNPWGHYRAPVVNLKRVGDEVIHGQKSSNTVADLQIDYPMLLHEVQQVGQYISIKMMKRGSKPTGDEVIKAFEGNAPFLFGDGHMLGYATPKDIDEFIESKESNFSFTRNLMGKVWNLERSAIDSYLKPGRKKNKKS